MFTLISTRRSGGSAALGEGVLRREEGTMTGRAGDGSGGGGGGAAAVAGGGTGAGGGGGGDADGDIPLARSRARSHLPLSPSDGGMETQCSIPSSTISR